MNKFKITNLNNNQKYYLINFCCFIVVFFSITLMFLMQFKVDILQENLKEANSKIVSIEDEIRVLEVEWVYLTTPERLRNLSDKYIKNNGYIAFNQVKDDVNLNAFYANNLQKQKTNQNVAMNEPTRKIN